MEGMNNETLMQLQKVLSVCVSNCSSMQLFPEYSSCERSYAVRILHENRLNKQHVHNNYNYTVI